MFKDCVICNTRGEDWGSIPVYNNYNKKLGPVNAKSGIRRHYSFLRCPKCEFFWVKDPDECYDTFYENDYWFEHMDWRGWPEITEDERIENDIKYANLRIPDMKRYVTSGKALDIGCSTGAQIKALKDNGFDPVHGVELNIEVCEQARQFTHCFVHSKALTGDDLYIKNNDYDFVLALDVLEHLTDPLEQAKIWVDKCKVGGIIWIEIPDAGCAHALNKGIHWADYVLPYEHVCYYRREHTASLFGRFGCETITHYNQWTTDRLVSIFRKVK